MKYLLLLLLLLISTAQASGDGWSDIQRAIVKSNECSSEAKLEELFKLSSAGKYRGTAQIQYLSEANEASFLNCPEGFLFVLMQMEEPVQSSVFKHFGIVHPPWEIGKALRPFENHKLYGEFVIRNFAGFLNAKEP